MLPRLLAALLLPFATSLPGQESPFGEVVEKEFPFYGTVVDARKFGPHAIPENVVPRGLVLKLGHGHFACYDPDLLRVALVWREVENGFLTMNAMGPGSYRVPSKKAPPGQKSLPLPLGTPIAATRVLPGWSTGQPALADPRPPAITPSEKGLGSLSWETARWDALEIHGGRPVILAMVGETPVRETWSATAKGEVVRETIVGAGEEPLFLYVAEFSGAVPVLEEGGRVARASPKGGLHARIRSGSFPGTAFHLEGRSLFVRIPPRQGGEAHLHLSLKPGGLPVDRGDFEPAPASHLDAGRPAAPVWGETVASGVKFGVADHGHLVVDDVGLPMPNPWKRNVRVADIAFLDAQRSAVVTFDGDIWIASGLGGFSPEVRWTRFASGLHEPKSIAAVDGVLHVFDRTGLLRVLDVDGNGEADRYENFCNLFTQTAETREFAMGMEPHPDGGFVIAKGGQSASTLTRERGTLLHIAEDGKSYRVLATGLRQPYPGVDPETGVVTSSDQQGNFVSTTPVHFFDAGEAEYHGFLPNAHPTKVHEPGTEIAEPPVWIPHAVCQSGATQVWLRGSRMGALEGRMLYLGYNRTHVFHVLRDPRPGLRQGAVVQLLSELPGPVLNGEINPRDGWLYLAGFQIWGGVSNRFAALMRVRPGAKKSSPALVEALAGERGVLLRFNERLEAGNVVARNFSAERWNYRRTKSYGSPHYRLDGKPGQEFVPVASALASTDGKAVFLGIPGMKPSHTLRVSAALGDLEETVYLTVHAHPKIDLLEAGFATDDVDLTVQEAEAQPADVPEPTAKEGRRLATLYGCVACHSTVAKDDNVKVGPTWKGAFGADRQLEGGGKVKIDAAYLRESILKPEAKVAKGFNKAGVGMPSYLGILRDHEVESIVEYIRSLK